MLYDNLYFTINDRMITTLALWPKAETHFTVQRRVELMLYVMYVSSGYRQLYPSARLSPFRYIPTLRASSRPFQMLINGRAEECQLQCGARARDSHWRPTSTTTTTMMMSRWARTQSARWRDLDDPSTSALGRPATTDRVNCVVARRVISR